MRRTIICALVLALALALVLALFCCAAQSVDERRETYFIIDTYVYQNIDGMSVMVLDYAKNGETQIQAVFRSEDKRQKFIDHLKWRGVVIRGDL